MRDIHTMGSNEHICPSNIAWLRFEGVEKAHLVPRLWKQDAPDLTFVNQRSDGLIQHNVYRQHALCGLDVSKLVALDGTIICGRRTACPTCWEKRW